MQFKWKLLVFVLTFLSPFLRADMGLTERLLLSDKKYANEIEVKACIITQEQACAALCEPPKEPIQLSNKELYGEKTYLFLRVRNNGKKHAWGTLACKAPTYHLPIKISIFGLGRSDHDSYNTYLIHLGSLMLTPNEPGVPKISFEWDELYTK